VIDPDGYRPNVGIVLMHPQGKVFWARRVRRDGWQFPQGGMNTDETPVEAMYRELREETGLLPEHVELLGATRAGCAIGCRNAPCAATNAMCASGRSRSGSCCEWSARSTTCVWT